MISSAFVSTVIKDEKAAAADDGTNEDATTRSSEEDMYSALIDAFAGVSNLLPAMLHLPGALQEKVVGVPLVTQVHVPFSLRLSTHSLASYWTIEIFSFCLNTWHFLVLCHHLMGLYHVCFVIIFATH